MVWEITGSMHPKHSLIVFVPANHASVLSVKCKLNTEGCCRNFEVKVENALAVFLHLCVCLIYAPWGKEIMCVIADMHWVRAGGKSLFAGSGSLQSDNVVE